MPGDVKDWEEMERELLQDCRVFTVSRMTSRSPHTGKAHPFYRIDSSDWVNVVALTPRDELVMVRQYRHGEGRVTLEIPGGLVDPGESAAAAAARELLEETGYRAGSVESFVARGAERVAEIANGQTEETVVELVPLELLRETLRAGRITSALVVAALYWFELESAR